MFGFASYKEIKALLASAGEARVVVAEILVDPDAADADVALLILANDPRSKMSAQDSILERVMMAGTIESEKDSNQRFQAASLNIYVSTKVT